MRAERSGKTSDFCGFGYRVYISWVRNSGMGGCLWQETEEEEEEDCLSYTKCDSWSIWRERNRSVFEGLETPLQRLKDNFIKLLLEDWQDNVPMWEKKFCYLVGRMPWKKVLSTKNFMHCHSSIVSWDDSAGKEAFDNAKRRFWEETNNLPSSSELPNPDIYIDEIDWNPCIEPELVRDLDREYFHPDDKYYLPSEHSSKVDNGWPDGNSDPWERAQVHTGVADDKATTGWEQWDDHQVDNAENLNQWGCSKATGWKQWDSSVSGTRNFVGDNNNAWGRQSQAMDNVVRDSWGGGDNNNACGRQSQAMDSVVRDSWGAGRQKSWGENTHNHSHVSSNWNAGGPNSWRNQGNNRWQDQGSSSRSWNQKSEFHKPNNWSNSNYRPRDYGSNQRNRGPNGGRGSSSGQKQWDNCNNNWDVRESGNIPRGRGQFRASCRKREGPDHYAVNHKGPKLQGGDSHSSRYWNGGNNNCNNNWDVRESGGNNNRVPFGM